ncbi:magnesium transporter CorA family protein [uncultured Jatrophihabitans sp.]|uniref:magnesium transporter CorA family protein n=1 Tax=uncultured Jatrophihabitans sp. TaxID=1610747 RepID=UPI0035C9E774
MQKSAECVIRTRVWRNGNLEAQDFPFDRVSDYLEDEDCLVWADVLHPNQQSLAALADELSLDPHAVEDATSTDERPKATRFATHLFLTASPVNFDTDTDVLLAGRVSVFSTKRAFVTVRLDDTLDIDAVVRRWDDYADLVKSGPRGLLHGVLDEIVDRYLDVLDDFDSEVDEVEDLLFDENPRSPNEVSRRTFVLRRALVDARRAMTPMRDVVASVRRGVANDENVSELWPFYDDLNDHVMHVAETIEVLRDSISSVFDTSMSLADTRMNTVMKKLTSWAAIIAVPTAITGFYGQNVPYPGFGHVWGFWVSIVLIVLIGLALYGSFRKRDWL